MCSFCTFKCWFIVFNVPFLPSGIALISIGALQYSTYSQMGTFAGSGLSKIAIVLIAMRATIALISLMGHVGAFISNSSMVACVSCCGADGYTDWSQSVGWENHGAAPDSCCVVKSEGCGQDKTKVHTKGCIWAIKLFLLKNLMWVGAVCIALGVTEVFGVLVSMCFCLDIKRRNYENLSGCTISAQAQVSS